MTQVITKLGDVALGDLVALKSGGPDAVVLGFVASPMGAAPVNVPGATYAEEAAFVKIGWATQAGSLAQADVPLAALNVKASETDKPK
jgi:hypothetical protein